MIRRILFFLAAAAAMLAACTDDDGDFTTSSAAMLTFSTDTVKLDTVFTTVGSRTYDFWVYNHSGHGLRLSNVRLEHGNQTGFRVNVDGTYLDNTLGSQVSGLEVRSGDSLRVFVELTAPRNGLAEPLLIQDRLLFSLESGRQQHVTLWGHAWDAIITDSLTVSNDTLIDTATPIVIMRGLRVDSAATLTLRATTLYFHSKAGIDVYGTLLTDSVLLRGDRLDHLFPYLPYDRVSGQWRGLRFYSSSYDNRLVATEIRNAEDALLVDSAQLLTNRQRLYMERCVVHSSSGHGLQARNAWVGLLGCQFSNAGGDCLAFHGGAVAIDSCTVAQFNVLGTGRGAALRFTNYSGDYPCPLQQMLITNTIVTGYDDDVVMGQTLEGDSVTPFAYHFEHSLMRTPALEDTVNCRDIIWETKDDSIQGEKHFRLVDSYNMLYDFHLDSLSTAHGMGCY